eukprot:TRINITY_DN6641_c0_g1_i3.p1 TRINITY_DN6641_c0_g1~~TRINITY_DN6641_c0_g1_i3.p1  ORF type:complete len:143 (+),score=25.13 TRINITY_DN6641_c0_g1_i3:56-430(+)
MTTISRKWLSLFLALPTTSLLSRRSRTTFCDAPQKKKESAAAEDEDNKKIDLDCPCVNHLKQGPCAEIFIESATCFNNSTAEKRGQDCIPMFRKMLTCFEEHRELYDRLEKEEEAKQKKLGIKV